MSTLGAQSLTQSVYTPHNYTPQEIQKVAVIHSEWNSSITTPLADGAMEVLKNSGLTPEQIEEIQVPGAFELIYAASALLKSAKHYDAIIVIGCVIRGDTSHYDCICNGVTEGIVHLNLEGKTPVIFGLITTENYQQAEDRTGGKVGHKGKEAAITALQMIDFQQGLNLLQK